MLISLSMGLTESFVYQGEFHANVLVRVSEYYKYQNNYAFC